MASDQDHRLGVFIQGRMLFIEDFCRRNALDAARSLEETKTEMLRRAGAPERVRFLEKLGAVRPLVTHSECSVDPHRRAERCVFEVSWG